MIFFDTESIGFVGPCVLIQYAEDDNEVVLHHVFKTPVSKTLELIERLCDSDVCAFNLTHDWFHIVKLYNVLQNITNKNTCPLYKDFIDAHSKPHGEITRYCLRPKNALDLFLHARKGPWQSLMDRKDIIIRKVPTTIVTGLKAALHKRLQLPWIYFARGTEGYDWKIEHADSDDRIGPGFCNLALRFKPSGSLKNLSSEIFQTQFIDLPLPKEMYPDEEVSDPYDTIPWQARLADHVNYWHTNRVAKGYAEQDVILLQRLYHHFGEPPSGDTDSELAVCIGAVRWRGFAIDSGRIQDELISLKEKINSRFNSPREALRYLHEVCTPTEKIAINCTEKKLLKLVSEWPNSLVGTRAREIIDARTAKKRYDLLFRIYTAKRFCPEFKIIGARSGRMSGGGGKRGSINPQGIHKIDTIRNIFSLASERDTLSGGDFDSFEVTIADAVYNDPTLRHDLESGKSFHATFGQELFDVSYEDILSSKGGEHDYYAPSKTGTFGLFYGQTAKGLAKRLGIGDATAESAYKTLTEKYPELGKSRAHVFELFCSMRQPGGIGTAIEWRDPPDFIETLLGFRRYYTLENKVVRSIFELAQNPPKELTATGMVRRSKREQRPRGAMMSALYACAFQIQAANMRSAANHVIQGTGAAITKALQLAIWHVQPVGIHQWCVQPLNMHDEVMCVHLPHIDLTPVVDSVIEKYRKVVPLLKMEWKTGLKSWADK